MKRFIIKLILVLAPIFLLVVSVNYFGDAANLFSINYEKKIATEILKGHNVTNITNYDERLLNKYLINNSKVCPDILILGSSRVMLINSTYFSGKTFFNSGVSGASIEDLLAIYQLYEQKGCLPKKIILGLDPWTLNMNNEQKRWSTLKYEYYQMFDKLTNSKIKGEEEDISSKLYQLVSPSYFKVSLRKLLSNQPKLNITDLKANIGFTKLADGSINYDLDYRSAKPAEVERRTLSYLNEKIYGIEGFDKLSPKIILVLEDFIKHLKARNIEISFFLAPYNSKVYNFIIKSDKYKQVDKSEEYFSDLALKYNIKILGSFNPFTLNMNDSDFYDGMHCNEKGIKKMLTTSK